MNIQALEESLEKKLKKVKLAEVFEVFCAVVTFNYPQNRELRFNGYVVS